MTHRWDEEGLSHQGQENPLSEHAGDPPFISRFSASFTREILCEVSTVKGLPHLGCFGSVGSNNEVREFPSLSSSLAVSRDVSHHHCRHHRRHDHQKTLRALPQISSDFLRTHVDTGSLLVCLRNQNIIFSSQFANVVTRSPGQRLIEHKIRDECGLDRIDRVKVHLNPGQSRSRDS